MLDPKAINPDWGWGIKVGSPEQKTTSSTSSNSGGGNTVPNNSASSTGSTFNYPTEWNQAGDFWSQLASGNYSNPGMDWLNNLLGSGGSQAALSQWGAAQQPAMMDQFSNMTKQMAEQAGVGGTRYGSGLQNSIANYGGQLQNQFQSNLMDRWLQAQGQDVGTAGLLSQLGLGAQTGGAEGLMSLGNMKSQLPLQVASMMGGLGGQLTNQQVDPWTQMMMSLIGPTGITEQQRYTPTTFQTILSGLANTLPTSWGGGGSDIAKILGNG
jgi:hypothetical protein